MFSNAVKSACRNLSLQVFPEGVKIVKSYSGWSQKLVHPQAVNSGAVASLLETESHRKIKGSILPDSPRYSTIRETLL